MALSGSITKQITSYDSLKLSWSATQNVANNTSTITAILYLVSGAYGALYAGATNNGSISIAGSSGSYQATSNIGNNQTKELFRRTVTVTHAADGTLSTPISASYNMNVTFSGVFYGVQSLSLTATLNTIPRASTPTLSKSTFDVGTSITINTNRASSSFTHTAKYAIGNASGTIATGITTSTSWTAPITLANQIPNATSRVGTITLYTYSGSTLIGTKSVGFTLTLPNTTSYQPTLTNLTVTEATAGISEKFGVFVQGQSTLAISYSATGVYGSTITKNSITANGQTFGAASATTSALTSSGSQTVTGNATDSRGRTATGTQSIDVTPYTSPTITTFNAQRCDADGTLNDQGTYVNFTYVAAIDSVGGKNDRSFKIQYKLTTDTTWTTIDITPATDHTINGSTVQSGFSVDNNYNVQLVVADYFMSVSTALSVPTAFVLMDFHSSGTGLALGQVAQNANRFDVYIPTHLYAPTDTEDAGFLRFRRSDGSVLGFLTTGPNGTGLKLHMYDRSAWKSAIYINEDGTLSSTADIPWTEITPLGTWTGSTNVAYWSFKNGVLYIYVHLTGTISSGTPIWYLPEPILTYWKANPFGLSVGMQSSIDALSAGDAGFMQISTASGNVSIYPGKSSSGTSATYQGTGVFKLY